MALLVRKVFAEEPQSVAAHHRPDFCAAEPFLKKRSPQFREMRRVERHRNAAVEIASPSQLRDPHRLRRVSDGTRDG